MDGRLDFNASYRRLLKTFYLYGTTRLGVYDIIVSSALGWACGNRVITCLLWSIIFIFADNSRNIVSIAL